RELGLALDHLCEREQQARRAAAVGEITRVLTARHTIDEVFAAFAAGTASLVPVDLLTVLLVHAPRREFARLSVTPRTPATRRPRERWMPLEGTLLARVVSQGAPVRVDDAEREEVPELSRQILAAGAFRSVVLVPLASDGQILGAVVLAANRPRAFGDAD